MVRTGCGGPVSRERKGARTAGKAVRRGRNGRRTAFLGLVSAFVALVVAFVISLEEVADLVDGFGGHHAADDTHREAGRPHGHGGTHAGARAVTVAAVVFVVTVVPGMAVRGVGAVAAPAVDEPADPAVDLGVPVDALDAVVADGEAGHGVMALRR